LPLAVTAAAGHPDAGLVGLDGVTLAWRDVELATAAAAAALIDVGITPGARVAILHPKSTESFLAVHAVLRAGAVVVPLDPLGASAALQSILEQIQAAAVIGAADALARKLGPALAASPVPIFATGSLDPLNDLGIDPDRLLDWRRAADSRRTTTTNTAQLELPQVDPEDPAYVIFTSGSTGVPKGIVHSHRSGWAYAVTAIEHHRLRAGARVAGIPPLHFDMSTFELYSAPLAGASAVTISEAEQRFPASLSQRLADEGVTHIYAVPFLLRQLQERGALADRDLSALEHIGYAGEAYAPGALAELMTALPGVPVTNLYGPAETNVVTSYDVDVAPRAGVNVPIGRLWPDCDWRLVNERGEDVAEGEPGELIVSAPTSMTSYWQLPELTAARLTPNASDAWPWYATGDIVERHGDTFWYLGRRDHQVKIRGFRLELEAIEATLTDAPGVEHAVVAAIEDADRSGEMQLVACVVLKDGAALDVRAIKRWCAGQLAPVAVPTNFRLEATLPMTASGKIDRAAVRKSLAASAG
jgi:amino acid adenylation domain-containing protein